MDLKKDGKVVAEKSQMTAESMASPWSKWYQENPERGSRLAKYIEDASKEWQTTLASQHGRMSVDKDSNISSLDGFRDYLATLNQQHRKKRVNSSLGNPSEKFALFQDFAEGFSGIVDALATVVPYGLGSVAWGACSLVVAILASKHLKESSIAASLDLINQSLPRLDAYRELYPTDDMVELTAKLHAKILEYLFGVYKYFQQKGWRGLRERIVSFIPFISNKNSIDPIVFSIQQISKDVTDQGAIGQAAEIRDIRLNGLENAKATGSIKSRLEHVEKVVERNAAKVSELSSTVSELFTQVQDIDTFNCSKDLEELKHLLVHPLYELDDVVSTATRQIQAITQTSVQRQACQEILRHSALLKWLERPSHATSNKIAPSSITKSHQKGIVWLTSKRHTDHTISRLTLDVFEKLTESRVIQSNSNIISEPPLVLRSMHQNEVPQFQTARTATSLVNEALYQLLLHHPTILRKHPELMTAIRQPSKQLSALQNLERQWFILLDHLYPAPAQLAEKSKPKIETGDGNIDHPPVHHHSLTPTPAPPPTPIYWLIDRIDACSFKREDRAPKLEEFAAVLVHLVRRSRGCLRVLFTSCYEPGKVDLRSSGWSERDRPAAVAAEEDEEGDEEGGELWREFEVLEYRG